MTELVQRTYDIESKSTATSRSIRVRASSAAIDSYDEIVDQDWNLERYLRNPVVLYGHNKSGLLGLGGAPEDTLPIGFGSDVRVVGGCLEATLNFVNEKASPLAERVLEGFKQGSIRAVSVGFVPGDLKAEKVAGREVYRMSKCELFEISVVPMGANPEAVALSAKAAAAQRTPFLKAVAQRASVTSLDARRRSVILENANKHTVIAKVSSKGTSKGGSIMENANAFAAQRERERANQDGPKGAA
jgi:hypothetical protein